MFSERQFFSIQLLLCFLCRWNPLQTNQNKEKETLYRNQSENKNKEGTEIFFVEQGMTKTKEGGKRTTAKGRQRRDIGIGSYTMRGNGMFLHIAHMREQRHSSKNAILQDRIF